MARLGAAMKCIQFLLFILNFMFLLVGALLITISAVILGIYTDYETFIDTPYLNPAELVLACGIILLLVSFYGCVGAVRQSTLMINMYALLLFIVLIIEIAGVITAFVMRCTVTEDIEIAMNEILDDYKTNEPIRKEWDYIQENLRCCGVHSPHDWAPHHIDGPTVNMSGLIFNVPYSCCEDEIHGLSPYQKGCLTVLGDYAAEATLLLAYVGAGIGMVQLFSVFFACVLAKGIRKAKTVQEMDRQQNRQRIYEEALSRHPAPPFLHVSASSEA